MNICRIFSVILLSILACSNEDVPEITEWVGLTTKNDGVVVEKIIRTAGEGEAEITWWAGGYMYEDGKFGFELIDLYDKQEVLNIVYHYGDENTGKLEKPHFDWWHAENKGKIHMHANRKYKMKLWGMHLAEPGAGWGMWLYRFGETPRRRESPER